ncbi:MAG: c-type cytochrome biogenesis protein CcsB [Candidatus Omnitrophica bacterium]|nr:c-type cytochrome biogenesis protein CcsB [Candidatus Omnitrophota bacterium]
MNGYISVLFNAAFFILFASSALYVVYFVGQRERVRAGAYALAIAGLGCLSALIAARSFAAGAFSVFGLHESLVFFAWVIVAAYLFVERKSGSSVNAFFVMPLAVMLLGAAKFIDSTVRPLPPALQSRWLGIHVTSCFLGYACFVLAFCFAVLYLWQEAEVKSRKVDRYFFRLPSLGMLDSTGYKAAALGFVFLSIGIISGSVWAQRSWGAFWSWDPKETWSLVLWLVYLAYLHGRVSRGWKGRRSAYCAIAGFIVMIFTYLGVPLLFPGLHAYL